MQLCMNFPALEDVFYPYNNGKSVVGKLPESLTSDFFFLFFYPLQFDMYDR